jgi:4-diphosphocytidyl-2-C-methyl-D-erythritol kinase
MTMTPVPPALRLLAPAKINLHLRVGPAAGGFHPVLTWMCTVSLFDMLTLSRAAEQGREHSSSGCRPDGAVDRGPERERRPPIELVCDDPTLPCDASNLIVRAATILAEEIAWKLGMSDDDDEAATREGGDLIPGSPEYVHATLRGTEGSANPRAAPGTGPARWNASLQKRIPTGAGLGGGSSDAARAILGLDRAWGLGLGRDRLSELASRLGSDVPFFLHGPSSVCTGRGQVVRPTPSPAVARWALLVLPGISMPTPAVYQKFDEMGLGKVQTVASQPNWRAWSTLAARELLGRLVNDLEAPAFALRPDLGALRAAIEVQLDRPVRMSGSGSSLFTLFEDEAGARDAAAHVSEAHAVNAVLVELAPKLLDDLGY